MEVRMQHITGSQFKAEARGHRVFCDQPVEKHGGDQGMTPPELFLASIGACAMHYAVDYLRTRDLPTEGLDMRVTAAKGGRPAKITEISIGIETPVLDSRNKEGLLRAVNACLLHRTLLDPPRINITLEDTAPVRFDPMLLEFPSCPES